jgi:hypothetical protein
MPWGGSELYSYTHDWLFFPGDRPRMVVAGSRGSPGVWRREAANPEGVVLLSDDAGDSWRTAFISGQPGTMPWMPWVIARHPTDDQSIFVSLGDGSGGFGFNPAVTGSGALYVSHDRGDSFEPVLANLPSILTAWVAAS